MPSVRGAWGATSAAWAALGGRAVAAVADRADGARGQPPDRGQPTSYRRDQPGVRAHQQQHRAVLGEPIDRPRRAGTRSASATTSSATAIVEVRRAGRRPGWRRWRRATRRSTSHCSTSAPTSRFRARDPHLAPRHGHYTEEPIAEKLLSRVAKDENLHMIFYRNIVTAALQLSPSQTIAVADQVVDFQIPGSVIPGFSRRHADGPPVLDLRIHHDDIVAPRCCGNGACGSSRGHRRGRREGARGAGRGGRGPRRRGRVPRLVERRAEAKQKKAARRLRRARPRSAA